MFWKNTPAPVAEATDNAPEQLQLPEGHDDRNSRYWINPELRPYWHAAAFDPFDPFEPDARTMLLADAERLRYIELFESHPDAEQLREAQAAKRQGQLGQRSEKLLADRIAELRKQAHSERETYAAANRERIVSYIDHHRQHEAAAKLRQRDQDRQRARKTHERNYRCPTCGAADSANGIVDTRVLGMPAVPLREAPAAWRYRSCLTCYLVKSQLHIEQCGSQVLADGRTRKQTAADPASNGDSN